MSSGASSVFPNSITPPKSSNSLSQALRTPAQPNPATPAGSTATPSMPTQAATVAALKSPVASPYVNSPSPTGQAAVTNPTSATNPVGAKMTTEQQIAAGHKFDIYTGKALSSPQISNANPAPVQTPTEAVKSVIDAKKPVDMTEAEKQAAQETARVNAQNALMAAYKPQLDAIDATMNNELSSNSEEAKYREQAFLQNLAVRGILNTSSEDPVQRKKYYDGEAKISSAIRDKYTLQKMQILGKIGDDAYQAGIKRADQIISEQKNQWDMYYKELESQRDTSKLLSDQEYQQEDIKLKQAQAEVDKKYKEGSITIDQKNAETARIKAESDRLVNAAQIRKLDAETGKIGAETNATSSTDTKRTTAQSAYDIIQELKTGAGKSGAVGAGLGKFINAITPGDIQTGTEAAGYKTKIEQLKNTLALGNLDKLKGPMSDKDIEFVRNIVTSLSPSMSETQFDSELQKLEKKFVDSGLVTATTGSNTQPNPPTQSSSSYSLKGVEYVQGNDGLYYPKP